MVMSREKACDGTAARTRQWVGTWAEVEQAQLESMLAATPAQRLAWLEEAMRLAYASGALRGRSSRPAEPEGSRPTRCCTRQRKRDHGTGLTHSVA